MKFKHFFTALIIFTGIIGVYSFVSVQDDPVVKIKQQLAKWTTQQPVEKVYLQLDKPYYAAGDDIWFKTYVVSGSSHHLSAISGIVNVELIDARDSIKQSVKLPLDSGIAMGDFALPDTLHQGNYRIRAYTNYMRNAGSDYFFDQAINIINPIRPATNAKAKTPVLNTAQEKIDVQFFPESGYLVNGIPTKVAFKAVGPNGLGAEIKGIITDSKGQQVAQFASSHLGMGSFEMTPKAGMLYQAKISAANGAENSFALPKATDKGYVLRMEDDQNHQNLLIKVSASALLFDEDPNRQLTLIAQSAGKIYYTGKTKPGIAVSEIVIPKNKFPSGIVQFTLFSPSGEPLNERLVFIRNNDQLNLTVAPDRQNYSPRQKVKITLNAQSSGAPSSGSFSVSVTDETRVPVDEADENNILASLLLTSDLRGHVEQPAWYFTGPDDSTRAALDILMLTQGYHRFEWKQLMNNLFLAKAYQPEHSLQVSGTVLTPGGSKPVANAKVKLFDLDSIQFTRDTVTDANGRFVFKNLTFGDSVRFIVQARNSKNKRNVDIKMDRLTPVPASGTKNRPDFNVTEQNNLSVYAQSSKQLYAELRKYGLGNHAMTLQEVVIREKREALKYSSNLNGPGNADQIVPGKVLRDQGCVTISDCLQGRLVGVIFRNGIPYSTRDYRPMQLIVDGVYVEGHYLDVLNYNDIQAIEVLRNVGLTAVYGSRGGNGVMLITTRHGGDSDDYPEPIYGRGITTYYPKGYYKAREFYAPRYDSPKTNKQLADLRTTIFWKPNLLTGTDGKASFEYFNAGSKGTYRIVIEGIDKEGHLGHQVYHYKVE